MSKDISLLYLYVLQERARSVLAVAYRVASRACPCCSAMFGNGSRHLRRAMRAMRAVGADDRPMLARSRSVTCRVLRGPLAGERAG